jgi:hypothetical protein
VLLAGNYSEAEPLFRRALRILVNSSGLLHPNTITGKENLSALPEQMKRHPKVRKTVQYLTRFAHQQNALAGMVLFAHGER